VQQRHVHPQRTHAEKVAGPDEQRVVIDEIVRPEVVQDLERDVVAGREEPAEQKCLVAVLEDDGARGGRSPRGGRQPEAGQRDVRDPDRGDPAGAEQDVGIP
jgi:hypothetical protein